MKGAGALARIVALKRKEAKVLRKAYDPETFLGLLGQTAPTRSFKEAIIRRQAHQIHLIGELKKASPSKGVIRPKFEPGPLAAELESAGVSALSVLTDAKFFQGSHENLKAAKAASSLPVLRKDFLLDENQIRESRLIGADAVLLIARLLPGVKLKAMVTTARQLSMAALVEVHTASEVKRALDAGAEIIGVNNRDLSNFKVRFETAAELRSKIPAGVIAVCESGVETARQVEALRDLRYDAVLIGETIMRARRPGHEVRELLHG